MLTFPFTGVIIDRQGRRYLVTSGRSLGHHHRDRRRFSRWNIGFSFGRFRGCRILRCCPERGFGSFWVSRTGRQRRHYRLPFPVSRHHKRILEGKIRDRSGGLAKYPLPDISLPRFLGSIHWHS